MGFPCGGVGLICRSIPGVSYLPVNCSNNRICTSDHFPTRTVLCIDLCNHLTRAVTNQMDSYYRIDSSNSAICDLFSKCVKERAQDIIDVDISKVRATCDVSRIVNSLCSELEAIIKNSCDSAMGGQN